MKEKIVMFYSKYIKRYRLEWELQNGEIDQLRSKYEEIKKEKDKINEKYNIELSNSEIKNNQIQKLNFEKHQLYGRIGGLTKYNNKIKKQNLKLQDEKKSLCNIIRELSLKIDKRIEKKYPTILEIKNMRKNQIRKGK